MSIVFRLVGLPFALVGGSISLVHEGVGLAVETVKDRRQRRKISSQLHHDVIQSHCARGSPKQGPYYAKGYEREIPPRAQNLLNDSPPPYSEIIEQLPVQPGATPLADGTASPSSRRLQKPRGSEKRRIGSEIWCVTFPCRALTYANR